MEKKTLGTFLAALRKASGMTQRELAEKLNVSDKAVSRWERDESAPDLMLIPVLSEIFGVTSDELLRGERSTGTANPERAAAKAEKQLCHLLKDTKTKFYTRSAIAAAIALTGLIAATVGNAGFLRALIGFLAGCIFFVVALICEVVFLIQGLSALDSDDFGLAHTAAARNCLIAGSEWFFSGILVLFAFCLPLAIFVPDPYMGMQASSWIPLGLLFAAAAALLASAAVYWINIKLGIHLKPELKTPLGKLRIRCAKIAILLLLILGAGHLALAAFLSANPQTVGKSHRFDTLEDFKQFMETPTSHEGEILTLRNETSGVNGTYVCEDVEGNHYQYQKDYIEQEIYAHIDDTEPLLTYRHLNQAATYTNFGNASNDLLPIYVMSSSQVRQANRICELLCAAYCITYAIALLAVHRYYRKKRNML